MNTWVELDRDTMRSNIELIRSAMECNSDIILMMKADAYGHGMHLVAPAAWRAGIRRFAVAHIDEARLIHSLLPEAWILLIGILHPSDAPEASAHRIIPILADHTHAAALSAAMAGRKTPLECHMKVDTGMGRIGFPHASAISAFQEHSNLPGLKLTGLCTHLAESDGADDSFARAQMAIFCEIISICRKTARAPLLCHAANSGAISIDPACHLDAVRTGILFYGYGNKGDGPGRSNKIPTRPFLQWKTHVVQLKKVSAGTAISYDRTFHAAYDTQIATLDVGYSDGYPRLLSNRGTVLIRGRRCPVAGRVTMNLTMADAGPDSGVQVGDEAVLIGRQENESVWADELAGRASTIPYEILTNIRTTDKRFREQ
jgi:alanine racemase